MTRVKRGNVARKRRKKILNRAKGFRASLSKLFRQAKPAVYRAMTYEYRDRKRKKRDFRQLWIARINAAVEPFGLSYSKFISKLKSKNCGLNRKVLSEIAIHKPEVFKEVVNHVK